MAKRVENTRSYRRRRLATKIRSIKAALRKGDCYGAETLFTDAYLDVYDKHSFTMRLSSVSSLRKKINACYRKRGR